MTKLHFFRNVNFAVLCPLVFLSVAVFNVILLAGDFDHGPMIFIASIISIPMIILGIDMVNKAFQYKNIDKLNSIGGDNRSRKVKAGEPFLMSGFVIVLCLVFMYVVLTVGVSLK